MRPEYTGSLLGTIHEKIGAQQSLVLPVPAAGVNSVLKPPSQLVYEVLMGKVTVQNNGTAAAFAPTVLVYDADNNLVWEAQGSSPAPAAGQATGWFATNITAVTGNNQIELPQFYLTPGMTMMFGVTSPIGTMQIVATNVLVRAVPFGPKSWPMGGLNDPSEGT